MAMIVASRTTPGREHLVSEVWPAVVRVLARVLPLLLALWLGLAMLPALSFALAPVHV